MKDDDLTSRRSAPYKKWRTVFIFLGAGLVAIPVAVHYVVPSIPFYYAAFLLFAAGLAWAAILLASVAFRGAKEITVEDLRALPKSLRRDSSLRCAGVAFGVVLALNLIKALPESIWASIAGACQRLGLDRSPEFYAKWLPFVSVVFAALLWLTISRLIARRKSQRTS